MTTETMTIHLALFEDEIRADDDLRRAAMRGSEWINGLYFGQPIDTRLLDDSERAATAERIEQGIIEVGAALGCDWREKYHDAIWSHA